MLVDARACARSEPSIKPREFVVILPWPGVSFQSRMDVGSVKKTGERCVSRWGDPVPLDVFSMRLDVCEVYRIREFLADVSDCETIYSHQVMHLWLILPATSVTQRDRGSGGCYSEICDVHGGLSSTQNHHMLILTKLFPQLEF